MKNVFRQHYIFINMKIVCFFFQAEDGIRDLYVTEFRRVLFRSLELARRAAYAKDYLLSPDRPEPVAIPRPFQKDLELVRSEERRVGKECRSRWVLYL